MMSGLTTDLDTLTLLYECYNNGIYITEGTFDWITRRRCKKALKKKARIDRRNELDDQVDAVDFNDIKSIEGVDIHRKEK